MEFHVTYGGVALGRAVLVAGEPGVVGGHQVIIVRSEIESTGLGKLIKVVRDDMRTWIDLSTGAPIKHEADMLFGDDKTVQSSRFTGRNVVIDYTRNSAKTRKQRFLMPAGEIAHDSHTVLGAVRAWRGRPGDSVTFYGLNGRRMWLCEVRIVGPETVRTAMGLTPAIRLEGTAKRLTSRLAEDPKATPRTMTIWLSDDANRLPLRVLGNTEHGQVQMEMTRYRRTR